MGGGRIYKPQRIHKDYGEIMGGRYVEFYKDNFEKHPLFHMYFTTYFQEISCQEISCTAPKNTVYVTIFLQEVLFSNHLECLDYEGGRKALSAQCPPKS